ncbi:MAG: amidohydrolase family protein [Thermoflexaceae bacterium]|nr:amidohydrolase family protein [Thermoflexaceae bacterium]
MANDQPPLLLRGGAVFDAESRAFRPGVDVLCSGGRIAAVRAGAAAPGGATEWDCTGRWLIPGLIDCHVHITSAGDPNEMTNARGEPLPVRAWKAAEYARRTLQAGITAVRDLGAAEHLNIQLAGAVESGLVEGPRILAAGLGVTMTGGHGHGFIAREADGPDEVRKGVREQLRAGAKAIKLFASGGVMTPGVDPRSPSFTEDEMRAGVEEAHKAFRVVAAHAQATEGIKNAIRAGVDSIEHGVWLDDEAIGLMCERRTYLVPTLTAPHHIYHGGLAAGIPPFMVEKARQVLEDHIASYRAALKAGVRVAMGTDQGTPLNRPGDNAQEIVRMAEHGLSPAAALLAATAWAADLLRLQGECGRIQEGLAADLLVLRADPIEDVASLNRPENIDAVVKAGRIVAGQAAKRRTNEPA